MDNATARLANPQTLVLGYQLPFPQAFVILGRLLADDPALVRSLFALWGGVLAAGGVALLSLSGIPRSPLFGALLFATDPLLTHYSVVPYQEPIAYGLLMWAFYFAISSRPGTGAVLMAGACLSRFETWLFLPLFAWVSPSRIATLTATVPVLAWTLWWQGLAPAGLYVLDLDPDAARLPRVFFLWRKFVEYSTPVIPALAIAGLVVVKKHSGPRLWKTLGAIALALAVVVTLGHEYPPGSGQMSERLIHLPVLVALLLSAAALAHAGSRSPLAFVLCLIATLGLGTRNVRFEVELLEAAERNPDLALAREGARVLEGQRKHGECVDVQAPAVESTLLDAYVAKVAASLGDRNQALARAQASALASPDRDRLAAHLRAPPGTVRGGFDCPLLVVIDGGMVTPESPSTFYRPLGQINAGPRKAQIFRKSP